MQAKLVRKLNATSATEMGSLDYDAIVDGYNEICIDFFYTVHEDHALVILSHCVYDMSSEELISRHSAYGSLLSFVEFSAQILGQEGKGHQMITHDDGCRTRASILRVRIEFLLNHMGNALSRETTIKKVSSSCSSYRS